jgi:mercuric ion transport protein
MSIRARPGNALLTYLSLFGSAGTLVCCALPSLLVLAGLGATVASVVSAVPWLVTLSRHKEWVFAASGLLIGLNFAYVYAIAPRLRAGGDACLPGAPDVCQSASRAARVVLWISTVLYVIGFFSAFLLGRLLFWWSG